MSTTSTPSAPPSWAKRSVHTVTCPSGQRLKIRLPGIATLLERGELPATLASLAVADVVEEYGSAGAIVQELQDGGKTEEMVERLKEFARYQRFLCAKAVVAVEENGTWVDIELTDELMDDLPEADLAMVAEIVQRIRGRDALGVKLGVEPLDRWEFFRHEHGCGEDCEACARIVHEFSSVDEDDV